MGTVGRAGTGCFLCTWGSSTLPHDLCGQHLGLLPWLHRFQVSVHAVDDNSHVGVLCSYKMSYDLPHNSQLEKEELCLYMQINKKTILSLGTKLQLIFRWKDMH